MRLLLLCLLLFVGCSTSRRDSVDYGRKTIPVTKPKMQVWEFWKPGYTLDGVVIDQQEVVEADRLYSIGKKQAAVDLLQQINLLDYEQTFEYNVLYRIWSYQLATPDPIYALNNIRSYCQRNIPAAQMPDYFAMLLAFSHGGNKNAKKSLAWFSYAIEKAKTPKVKEISKQGLKLLLQTLDNSELEYAKQIVNPDVKALVEKEVNLRLEPGYINPPSYGYFWEAKVSTTKQEVPISVGEDEVNLILPLVGKFKGYGISTKNGIKLALDIAGIKNNILDGSDQNSTLQSFTRVSTTKSLLVGPAIATAAQEIATKANENNIPTIILTKNSDFVPFGSVCRFAPTLEQQVDSLVRMVNAKYGFTKYGVVYPENTGKETLQAFRQKLVEFNLSNSGSFSYDNSLSAFTGIGQQITDAGIEAILFAGNVSELTSFLREQNVDFRANIKVLGLLNMDEPEIEKNEFLNGLIFLKGFKNNSEFEANYLEQFKKEPDFFAYQGYDLGMIILESIKLSKERNLPLINAIREYRALGLTGEVSVNSICEITRKFSVSEVQNNTIVEVIR